MNIFNYIIELDYYIPSIHITDPMGTYSVLGDYLHFKRRIISLHYGVKL